MGFIRVMLIILLSYLQVATYAQNKYGIGAIVETRDHLWILDNVERESSNFVLSWKVKGKGKGKFFVTPKNIFIKNYKTGKVFSPKTIFPSKSKTKKFKSTIVKMVFPPIGDDKTIISIFSSPSFYVDSLSIPSADDYFNFSGELIMSDPRYRIPIYNHHNLATRKDSIDYSDSLFNRGITFYKKKDYHRALICFEKCYAFDKLLDDYVWLFSVTKRKYYDYSSMWLGRCYYKVGELLLAQKYSDDYKLEPYDRAVVTKSDSIYNRVNDFSFNPKSGEVINECIKMCALDSITFGTNHHRYALSLYELGQAYSSHRDFDNSMIILKKAYDVIASIDEDNWLAKSILEEMAKVEHEEGEIRTAIHYLEKSLGIKEGDVSIIKDYPFLSRYDRLANYYSEIGKWEKAIILARNRVEYWKAKSKYGKVNNENYISALKSLAATLSNSGKVKEALRVFVSALETDKIEKYDLMDLGFYFYELGDYESTKKYYQEAFKDSLNMSEYHQNRLAMYYSAIGDFKKAIEIEKAIVDTVSHQNLSYSNLYNGYTPYTTYLSNLASFYFAAEQFDSALVYETRSLGIKERYTAPNSDDIAYSYLNIGRCFGEKGNRGDAIKHILLAYNVFKTQKQQSLLNRSLEYLSRYSFKNGDKGNLVRYIRELLSAACEDLLSTLQELTYNERSKYIKKYSDLLNSQVPMYAYYAQSDSLTSMAYDATLLIKGALLNSENSVYRLIGESNDASLKKLWEDLRISRYQLSQHQGNGVHERNINMDSLQTIINNVEDSIIVKCKEYGDITQNMKLKWQDIQKSLSSSDVAIEFLSFPIENDSVMYAALTLRKDDRSPKLVPLFEEKQLKNISDSLCYQSKDMTQLVWEPLFQELQGVKNIYFSPSGALYNIGIEYLSGMENYNIYRLSSTRELVNRRDINANNRAVLYGGLDYEAKLDTLSQSRSRTRFNEKFVDHSDVRNMKYRGGQENLTHTLDEVEQIEKEFNRTQWKCLLDTLSLGTEESFKSLSGKKINTLHIATHGFYYTPEESDNIGYDFLLPNDQMSAEDKSLSRSGLLMSGANHILDGDSIPENVEDGILTAKEIADVDLRGLDMVVLSACQTGLGDISQGEGVFGLQRGFKKAGANSILMSLWEVNDEATQILMTQFYKNLVSGQSKRQSLHYAQKYLREYNNGRVDEPKYWAAFILLDGIN